MLIQRDGFTTVKELTYQLMKDLVANGFKQIFPTVPLTDAGLLPAGDLTFVLEAQGADSAGGTGNEMYKTQPWRIRFETLGNQKLDVQVATHLQLLNDGTSTKMPKGVGIPTAFDLPGLLGDTPQNGTELTTIDNGPNHFVDRRYWVRADEYAGSYPMSYLLTITERGIALCVWEHDSDDVGSRFSWVVVQRAVDHKTGAVQVNGHAPVFCAYSTMTSTPSTSKIRRFIVREADVLRPTDTRCLATVDSVDMNAIMNSTQQVRITEDNKYVVSCPNRLNTPRYAYTQELDLIAHTSADVVSQWSNVPLTMYGEGTPRVYRAMHSNGPNNTNMRILLLVEGGGV